MPRPSDRVFFAVTATAGLLVLVACLLPAFELYLYATVGAGNDQRVYDFHRDVRFATYYEAGALVFPLTGIVLLATGVAGVLRPLLPLVVVAVAVTIPAFVQTIKTVDIEQGPSDNGVSLCDEPRLEDCVFYLAPAVRDFRAAILRRPIARQREFEGPSRNDFNVTLLAGWQLIGWTVAIYSLFAWFRGLLFLPLTPRKAIALYAVLLVVVLVLAVRWWLRDWYS